MLHGDTRPDDYFWLREKDNPAVAAYLREENAYTGELLKPTEAFQETLYQEMLGRIKEDDSSVPFRRGGYFYYSRTEKGKQYPIYCRKAGGLDAPEEVMLDLNLLAAGHPFFSLGAYAVSDDSHLLAYSTDVTGFREYTLYVKDLRTGTLLPGTIDKVSSVAWAADNATIFYVTEDEAKRPYRFWRHRPGLAAQRPRCYEETDQLFRIGVERSRSRAFLFLGAGSFTSSRVALPARPRAGRGLADAHAAREGSRVRGGSWGRPLLHPHERERPAQLPPRLGADRRSASPELAPSWCPIARASCWRTSRSSPATSSCTSGRAASPASTSRGWPTASTHHIEFPEPTYEVSADANAEFDTRLYRFRYQSLITPASVFDYDVITRAALLLKQTEVLGGYDPARYRSERIWATAPDGVSVPISLVCRAETPARRHRAHAT